MNIRYFMAKLSPNVVPASFIILIVLVSLGSISIYKFISGRTENECVSLVKYTNKHIDCNQKFFVNKSSYASLGAKINNFIAQEKSNKVISDLSVYFRDLDNGPTLGINEHTSFAPASLLKVPVLLTYLRYSEDHPDVLTDSLTYKSVTDSYHPFFPPQDPIKEGTEYSVEDLLDHMIIQSDNQAYFTLLDYLAQISPKYNLLAETVRDLGIIDFQNSLDVSVTVKSYASIFQQLYNNSFFSKRETSEFALNLLAKTDFDSGLKAGVPKGTEVAHKFGEREYENGKKQLQDCGIVYYPNNPYLVCIMARGDNMNSLAEVIAKVSQMIYEEFNSRAL